MSISIRRATEADIPHAARIIYDAFAYIHDKHRFPRDFPAPEAAHGLAAAWINHPSVWSIVAESQGAVVGFNALDQRDQIGAPGPVVVDPKVHGKGVGRRMMQAVIERAEQSKMIGMRLLQDSFNTTSLSLYASMGFDVKESIALMGGSVKDATSTDVRAMTEADVAECAELCRRVVGITRGGDLRDALRIGFSPVVLQRGKRIVAYASAVKMPLLNHVVAESEADMHALIEGACALFGSFGTFLPMRQANLFRWCLSRGLKVIKPMNLMSRGEYREPTGAWAPSVLY